MAVEAKPSPHVYDIPLHATLPGIVAIAEDLYRKREDSEWWGTQNLELTWKDGTCTRVNIVERQTIRIDIGGA